MVHSGLMLVFKQRLRHVGVTYEYLRIPAKVYEVATTWEYLSNQTNIEMVHKFGSCNVPNIDIFFILVCVIELVGVVFNYLTFPYVFVQ